ncbi:pyridoxal-phosphate dependent enzyme [Halomonas sp.]|jgi:threonine dehydratase|uniref:pyridoxal-phosphate dependent enzyme n=1 Tax=Halomonas sp. TaxID=1486246 RepID=UPI003562E71E
MSAHDHGVSLAMLYQARQRLLSQVPRTPLIGSAALGARFDAGILLKLEALQSTGAFKLRGVTNMIAALIECHGRDALKAGVTTASTGNHGRAVAHAPARLGVPAVICFPLCLPSCPVAGCEESRQSP